MADAQTLAARTPGSVGRSAGRVRAWWNGLVGAIGAVVGFAPHVLHHVGLRLIDVHRRGIWRAIVAHTLTRTGNCSPGTAGSTGACRRVTRDSS